MPTTLTTGLRRRLLTGLAAAILYALAALALAAALPESAWPPIGGHGYAAGQATAVPAANLFAFAMLALAVFEPLVPAWARYALSAAAALLAAAAGPVLSAIEGGPGTPVWPGLAALAAVGVLIGALRVPLAIRA
ncbi:hypothetical protein [Glycomyces sp. NRRL B-16210]|uniref:hypothetical protein n=1 Tax=Glycomyces sp. NRRL B-16210 TaxID=1463821 RepID=UPI0004BED568|nr:hypothetical protein [Glycomyces sp. NRRL B-16210]